MRCYFGERFILKPSYVAVFLDPYPRLYPVAYRPHPTIFGKIPDFC